MSYQITETDAQVISQWLAVRMSSPNTVANYRLTSRQFMDFLQKPLTAATIEDATRFYEWLRAKGYSLASQKQKLDIIGGLFEFAREMEVVTKNPFRLIQRPKAKATLSERILTPDEMQRLIDAADTERNKALLQLLYFSAGRVSEVITLKWADLKEREGGGQVTLYGKENITRAILIPSPFWEELNAHRGKSRDFVFPSAKTSSHINRKTVWYIVNQAGIRAGLGDSVSPHWLRHAHATEALENGAPLHLLKESLGHRSIATTAKYLHTRPMESSSSYLGKKV